MTSENQNIDKQLFDSLGRRIGMTTLQIAELTGKRHDSVIRRYLTYCDDLGIDPRTTASSYIGGNSATCGMYVLDYSQTLGLVFGFRNSRLFNATVVQQCIIDEWAKTIQLSAIDRCALIYLAETKID